MNHIFYPANSLNPRNLLYSLCSKRVHQVLHHFRAMPLTTPCYLNTEGWYAHAYIAISMWNARHMYTQVPMCIYTILQFVIFPFFSSFARSHQFWSVLNPHGACGRWD